MAMQLPAVARTLARSIGPRYVPGTVVGLRAFASVAKDPAAGKSAEAPPSGPPKLSPGGRQRKRASYQYRSPRYYRGPFSPAQPPPPNDPASREFVPGPFTSERLADHYYDTLRSDIMLMTYDHRPYGHEYPRQPERLRSWDDSSPYHKNRPLRGPRGGSELPLLDKPRTFRNVPKLESITVHVMSKQALENPAYIAAAGTVVQAITGVKAEVCHAKANYAPWNIVTGKPCGVKATVKGPQAYRFLSSLIDVVMPRIKDYPGVNRTSGDKSGNIAFGFRPSYVQLFPEVEVNYDMYPPKMIPGMHIIVKTTATNDEDGRLLLESFGIPFYGKASRGAKW